MGPSSQLTLPLDTRSAHGRKEFIVGPGNKAAVGLIDNWPKWPGPVAFIGPSGSGKSHLVKVWAAQADAIVLSAGDLNPERIGCFETGRPIAVEDVDRTFPSIDRDRAIFALFERAGPLILTGREPPERWAFSLPDLRSRFAALLAFPLWAPDDELLAALARKLFTDRQLAVSDAVIMRIIRSLERSPGAIRDFVARADARALAEKRPINVGLIRTLLEERLP